MKASGPTNLQTKKLIAELIKEGNKRKQKIWKDIAKRLSKPRRKQPVINLWKLNKLGKKFKGKILLTPGKVLSEGELNEKIEIAAFAFSKKAKQKIEEKKGNAMSLKELLDKKIEPKKITIVK